MQFPFSSPLRLVWASKGRVKRKTFHFALSLSCHLPIVLPCFSHLKCAHELPLWACFSCSLHEDSPRGTQKMMKNEKFSHHNDESSDNKHLHREKISLSSRASGVSYNSLSSTCSHPLIYSFTFFSRSLSLCRERTIKIQLSSLLLLFYATQLKFFFIVSWYFTWSASFISLPLLVKRSNSESEMRKFPRNFLTIIFLCVDKTIEKWQRRISACWTFHIPERECSVKFSMIKKEWSRKATKHEWKS